MTSPSSSCSICGLAVPAGSDRCPACGNEIVATAGGAPPEPVMLQPAQRQGSGSKVALLVFLVLGVLLLVFFGAGAAMWLLWATPDDGGGQASMVTIRINAQPEGAQVFVDGAPVGTVPLVLQRNQSEVPLTVEVRHPGYQPATQQVVPRFDQSLVLALARAPESDQRSAGGLGMEAIQREIQGHMGALSVFLYQPLAHSRRQG